MPPNEREMDEVHEVMTPASPASPAGLSRHERRQQERQQAESEHRFTGVVVCELCGFPLELERETKPADCPACGFAYEGLTTLDPYDALLGAEQLSSIALERRRCAALESQAEGTAQLAEAVAALVDVLGETARDLVSKVGGGGGGGLPPRMTRRG